MKRIFIITLVMGAILLAACSGSTAPAASGEVVGKKMNCFAFTKARINILLAVSIIILQYLPDINNNSTPTCNVDMLSC